MSGRNYPTILTLGVPSPFVNVRGIELNPSYSGSLGQKSFDRRVGATHPLAWVALFSAALCVREAQACMAEERDKLRQRYPLVVEPPTGEPPLWIDERDRKGRPVEPTVKEAAGRIWRRVLYYVRRERNDHAEAAEVLEEAVFSVSARLQNEDELAPIQNLDSYLFHSFVRRFSKRGPNSVLRVGRGAGFARRRLARRLGGRA